MIVNKIGAMNEFIVLVAIFVVFSGALQSKVHAQGVQICCQCEAKNSKLFLDQIKEQLERQGGIHRRTVIGNECCDCECEITDGKWHSIIMVNEPGGCSINSAPVNGLKTKESTDGSVGGDTELPNNTAEPRKRWIL